MEVRVKVIVNARKESLEEAKDGRLIIALRAPREEGKANARLTLVLAEHYAVPVSHVRIMHGHQQSTKVVSILE